MKHNLQRQFLLYTGQNDGIAPSQNMLHTNLQKSIQFACDVDSDSDQHQFQHGKLILHKVEQLFCGDSVRIMQKENGGFCHKMHPD